MSRDYSSSRVSSTLEIVLDDQSISDSVDEESNDQMRQFQAGTTGNEDGAYRKKKSLPMRDPKSHRLIEKRRRDRMNACLSELLKLTPHRTNESQRRIEKTEIIEFAITHIRDLIGQLDKAAKNTETNIDAYRTGYRNGLSDVFEFLNDYSDHDQLLLDLAEFFKEKDTDLKDLTAMPDKKRVKYLSFVDKRIKSGALVKQQSTNAHQSKSADEPSCIIHSVEEFRDNNQQPKVRESQNSNENYDSNVKVPIFVLHPSGTHYLPMCIDASIVSHAFTRMSHSSHSSSTTDQAQCHPVSIPVNFNPVTALSDPYELDVQNINVIGTRHQTSVRPN